MYDLKKDEHSHAVCKSLMETACNFKIATSFSQCGMFIVFLHYEVAKRFTAKSYM